MFRFSDVYGSYLSGYDEDECEKGYKELPGEELQLDEYPGCCGAICLVDIYNINGNPIKSKPLLNDVIQAAEEAVVKNHRGVLLIFFNEAQKRYISVIRARGFKRFAYLTNPNTSVKIWGYVKDLSPESQKLTKRAFNVVR
jgi:hypothetical protein